MVSWDRTFADADAVLLLLFFAAAAVLDVVVLDPAAAAADTTGGMVADDVGAAAALVDWKRAFMRDSVLLQVHGSAIVTFQECTASWSALPVPHCISSNFTANMHAASSGTHRTHARTAPLQLG